ncbi:hypothetical protein SLEP1_g51798 [Rubroshorea leprosula]|uniref:Uncharacterized protein n=1 Tax=Rubroshorea leprosula TaxID=152421 RepID=A0AAV5M6Y8_9ROSI|nr:hypothetical protein SLEP1_g51798 [Rubroshorea leprosula]
MNPNCWVLWNPELAISRFCSSRPPCNWPKAPKPDAPPLEEKIGKSLILSFFSCSRTRFGAWKSFPSAENPGSARFLPSPVRELQLVGANFWAFSP